MTLENSDRRNRYLVTNPAGQSLFQIQFPLSNADYLKVYSNGEEITEYTVDLQNLTVLLDTLAPQNTVITVEGDRTVEREKNFPRNGEISSGKLNEEFDAVSQTLQESKRDLKRTLQLNKAEGDNVSTNLPLLVEGKAIIWGPDGLKNSLTNIDELDQVFEGISEAADEVEDNRSAVEVMLQQAIDAAESSQLSAAASYSAASSAVWSKVLKITYANSPYTVTNANSGDMLNVDTTGGNVVVNLGTIASKSLPFNIGIKKISSDANTVTINCGGSDTMDVGTQKVLASQHQGTTFLADDVPNPDQWGTADFGGVPDDSVGTSKLKNLAVTFAKLASSLIASLADIVNAVAQKLVTSDILRSYVSPWVAYTPTFTGFGAPTNVSVFSRRVGDTLEVRGSFTSGATTATEARISLGYNGTNNNVTTDAAKLSAVPSMVGNFAIGTNGTYACYSLVEGNVGYMTFSTQAASYAGTNKRNGADFSSATAIIFNAKGIPISGW